MIIFVLYAMMTWYLTMRWRRQWPSFAAAGAAVGALVIAASLARAGEHRPDFGALEMLRVLLWPYTILVGGVGMFIACLPRTPGPNQCAKCRYDLTGLRPGGLKCPECGAAWRGPGSGLEEKPVELIPIPKRPIKKRATP